MLNYTEHEFDALLDCGHIPVLGRPRPRTKKRFATVLILRLREDVEWLSKAQEIIQGHWRKLNAARKRRSTVSPNGVPNKGGQPK